MTKLLVIIAGLCFGYAAVPSAWACMKLGKNPGIPILTAWMVFVGVITMYAYLLVQFMLPAHHIDIFLTVNYIVEALSWGVILWYNYFPRPA